MLDNRPSSTEGINKILKNPVFANKTILKDMLPVKVSAVILDYAKPLLDKTDLSNKKAAKKAIQIAIEVWNNIIVVDKTSTKIGDKNDRIMRMGLMGAARQNLPHKIDHEDYFALVERKDTLYPDNNFFVIEHNVRWSDDGSEMMLAVVTNDADKVDI